MLKVKNLIKDYELDDASVRALDGVSFEVKDGEILGIMGQSGSGKTTLLKVLRGVESFNGGEIELDGLSITPDSSDDDFRKLKSMSAIHLQRNFGLWPGAAIENIIRRLYSLRVGQEALPAKDHPDYDDLYEESMKYLKLVGLDHKAEHFSMVLSGGEKQRLLIARQLAANPKLLLLDEPATMTCPATKQEVLDTIKKVQQHTGVKIIIVSHLPEIHSYLADRVVWIEKGKVVRDGKPGPLIKEFLKNMKPDVALPELKEDKVVIKVRDLCQRYYLVRQGEVLDIENMNVEFKKGEIVALTGPSGAGKTTLLHAMDGLIYPDDGDINFLLDGEWIDVAHYNPKRMELRRRTSIMYQEFALYPNSPIKYQLAYKLGVKGMHVLEAARKKAKELSIPEKDLDAIYRLTDVGGEKAQQELEKMGYNIEIIGTLFPSSSIDEVIKHAEPIFHAMRLPLSVLNAKPYQLSGGENVRAALALATITHPEYLLLDEPFGDLDPITLREVANSLKNISKHFGTTIILISHHMDFVTEVAHRAILIDNGDIIMDGAPLAVTSKLIEIGHATYMEHAMTDYVINAN
ncbi:MAG: ATP-binding cassette domain-containing protein [ANME-2 cluster archaeon]|nr:ATP-binding cassette domain-containing protein [ANME-2 cluster archaeon]MDF1532723.1 ATP-binding cassette domain-containing protein [ANME-2 cluster archaeon]